MITWGIVANSHDASLAVAKTASRGLTANHYEKVVWAGLAKDFSGVPNDPHLNEALIQHALNNYGAPDQVIWYERPLLKTFRQIQAGQGFGYFKENNVKKYLEKYNIRPPKGIRYVQHHTSHAAYAYYTQPHDDCAVICLDSIGEFETLTVWHGKNGKLKKIHSQGYPHSLGLFYSAMTQRMGFTAQRDEYLVSKYAANGDPIRLFDTMLKEIVHIKPDSSRPYIRMRENLHRGCQWWRPELNTEQDIADIAAATQSVFEYACKILSNYAHYKTNHGTALALSGGGALNRDMVKNISKDWQNVWVPPNPGDPGSCIGAILADKKQRIENIDSVWHKVV